MERKLEIDNQSLVEECLKGDKEALNLFYLRFAPRMLHVIRRYIRDEKDTEDILHDGFIVALTRLKSLRDPNKVDYWLASIMKNLSLQFLQEQDVAQLLHEEKEVEDPAIVDNIIDMEVLESLIRKLPPGYQKVFRLSILENKSHKEIAKILGIAPNSSSSQLFHAKMMMRQLITDYKKQAGIWSLLLIGLTAGVAWLIGRMPDAAIAPEQHALATEPTEASHHYLTESSTSEHNALATALPPKKQVQAKVQPQVQTRVQAQAKTKEEAIPLSDSEKETPIEPGAEIDSSKSISSSESTGSMTGGEQKDSAADAERCEYARKDEFGFNSGYSVPNGQLSKSRRKAWGLIAKAEPGLLASAISGGISDPFDNSTGNNEPPYLSPTDPDKDKNEKSATRGASGFTTRSLTSSRDFSAYSEMNHKNDFPVSFTLALSRALTARIGVEAGLSYTYLSTTFEKGEANSHCRWHYLGIPVRVTFRSFQSGRLKLYGGVGGTFEIPLYSSAHVTRNPHGVNIPEGRFNAPCVWTLSASYGAAIKLSYKFELFIEPTVQVYLNNKATVPNIWSDNRIGFSLPLGLRFNL